MADQTAGHRRADHEDCECSEELDHALFRCDCPGYPEATPGVDYACPECGMSPGSVHCTGE